MTKRAQLWQVSIVIYCHGARFVIFSRRMIDPEGDVIYRDRMYRLRSPDFRRLGRLLWQVKTVEAVFTPELYEFLYQVGGVA